MVLLQGARLSGISALMCHRASPDPAGFNWESWRSGGGDWYSASWLNDDYAVHVVG